MSKSNWKDKARTIPLRCQDIAHILPIARLTFPTPWKEQDFAYFITHSSGWCRGMFLEETLVAYVLSLVVQGEMDLVSIATNPSFQRMGYARQLLEEAKKAQGVGRITLEVNVHNDGAIRFYESVDFSAFGKRLRYYEGRDDALLMEWKK